MCQKPSGKVRRSRCRFAIAFLKPCMHRINSVDVIFSRSGHSKKIFVVSQLLISSEMALSMGTAVMLKKTGVKR